MTLEEFIDAANIQYEESVDMLISAHELFNRADAPNRGVISAYPVGTLQDRYAESSNILLDDSIQNVVELLQDFITSIEEHKGKPGFYTSYTHDGAPDGDGGVELYSVTFEAVWKEPKPHPAPFNIGHYKFLLENKLFATAPIGARKRFVSIEMFNLYLSQTITFQQLHTTLYPPL